MQPRVATAQWLDFLPRPLENGANVEAFSSFERDDLRGESRKTRWRDTYLRERLTLYSDGYSYHPRFILYHFSLAGSARQEEYVSTSTPSLGWRQGDGWEYGARVVVLPEHACNLIVSAFRYEPLFKEQSGSQHDSVLTQHSATLRYRSKPYFGRVGYTDDSVDSGSSSSNVTRVGVDGTYVKEFSDGRELSFHGAYNPSWFSSSQGLDGRSVSYGGGNGLMLSPFRLTSNVSVMSFDQTGRNAGRFESDQVTWHEDASMALPWRFDANASYRYDRQETTMHQAEAPVETRDSRANGLNLNLIHHLYRSVTSTYAYIRNWQESVGGSSAAESQSAGMTYTKRIPHGRVLAGVNGAQTETDNRGQGSPVNEQDSTSLGGYFELRMTEVDLDQTIYVWLTNPRSPFQRVELARGANYRVEEVANVVRIYVENLVAGGEDYTMPEADYVYEFVVSYLLKPGHFALRTRSYGANAALDLFDNLLYPYFNYAAVRSDVLQGDFPGTPVDSDLYTTGLLVHYGPVRVRGEYQDLQWDVSPLQLWRADVQYVHVLNQTTNLTGSAAYENRHYGRGTSEERLAFTEESESVAGSVQKELLLRSMSVSLGGAYSHTQGLGESDMVSLSAGWSWTIGKMSLSAGVNGFRVETSGTTSLSTKRDHELVYVRLQRQLF